MKIVIVVSPYAGAVEDNVVYGRACLFDSLMRFEAPFASHLLYTQVLNDEEPDHRERGLMAGREIMRLADLVAVYMDKGLSEGMRGDINHAHKLRIPVEQRWLSRWHPTSGSDATDD